MAQLTNLNVSPYFDDFDPNDNYYRVLFKPGYPVQARELTGLQSILQNQIEKFGQHFFKEGAKVIPGNTAYSQDYFCIQLNNNHLGIPVSYYYDQLVGRRIIGLVSGVTAIVSKVLAPEDSETGNTTLYISYLSTGSDNDQKNFTDGELLSCDNDILTGPLNNPFIPAGEAFASLISENATATGSAFSIVNGVYFVRGHFVNVDDETIILSQYTNRPSVRVGLRIQEEIVNADEDESLTDNSKGFNNYAAPGADRLKISLSLFAKPLDDFNDSNFVELAVINEGQLRSQIKNTQYSIIADELARRTYAESGDYTVTPFDVSLKETLNNRIGNNGLYQEGEFTYNGIPVSENLVNYVLSSGKAFVKGYEVETLSTTYLDVPKPRTSRTLTNQSINYNTGSLLKVNNLTGHPVIGLGNTYVVSLRSERVGVNSLSSPGIEVGVARVYDFALESGSYELLNSDINQWDLALYDVQTFSRITVNEPITLPVPTFVKGKYSGATAFLRSSVSAGTALTVYEQVGQFLENEPFIFNGVENNRVAIAVTNYGLSDVKSVYAGPELGSVGFAKTFTADTIQSEFLNVGIATITPYNATTGRSVIRSTNPIFPGTIVKENDIVQYSGNSGNPEYNYARVVSVATTSIEVVGVTTVTGVAQGGLPTGANLSVTDLKVLTTSLLKSEDNTLYTPMPRNLISNVDLTDAAINIRRSYTVNISGNQLSSALVAGANETFLPFDEERYTLIRSNGKTEELTSDRFSYTSGSTVIQINNLGANDTGATLVATLKKIKPVAKIKRQNRVNSIIIDKSKTEGSGVGATTLNDGLLYGNYPYGTRVQDEDICLNVADVVKIHAIYESSDTSAPSAPKMILTALNGPTAKTSDLVIGERIVGDESGAVGTVAEKISDSQIAYIPGNKLPFKEGESVSFGESKVQGVVAVLQTVSRDVTASYTFNNNQQGTFYDYSFIQRKKNVREPSKKLKVYFANGYFESSDTGDLLTKNSYDTFNYKREIQIIDGYRNTDIIDIRPKVSNYTVTLNSRSPLEFFGRRFDGSGNNVSNILASDESITTNYSYYLGRKDSIFLTKSGTFQVQYGEPSERPEKPVPIDDALEIATVELPAYLLHTSQASISFLNNKRYRMQDIRELETRIKNLEYYTSLSLLEQKTENLFIPDQAGLNKFKSGFFVDNFTSFVPQDENKQIRNSIDIQNQELRPSHYTNSIDLMVGPVEGVDPTADRRYLEPEGTGVKRSLDVITLDYTEKEWLKQTFATRTESVTPFLVSFWQASVALTPENDTWVDTARVEAKIINVEGNYSETMAQQARINNIDPQTGMGPVLWNSWETTWTGTDQQTVKKTRSETRNPRHIGHIHRPGQPGAIYGTRTITDFEDEYVETIQTGTSTRTGVRTVVTPQFDQTSQGDKVLSREVIQFMRSRNVEFVIKKTKPLTQLYSFFDGVNVTKYCVPKLLEIQMLSGVFQVGEKVIGTVRNAPIENNSAIPSIRFRVAQANHREGPYNAPSAIFTNNPYLSQIASTGLETYQGTPGTVQQTNANATILPSTYSSTTTVLNVDTFALSEQAQGDYYGWVETGMILVGETSGAQATISNVRLVSDLGATLIGSFYIPNPNIASNPRFNTGTKTFTVCNLSNNDQDNADTVGEDSYSASGTLETVQEQIISVRNAKIQQQRASESKAAARSLGMELVKSTVISTKSQQVQVGYYDPLAQSFQVEDETGVFLTSCDVFFQTKDDMGIPLTFQLRTMQNGTPTQKILPFSEVVVTPDQIVTSQNGTVPTRITFEAPVYLEGGGEYAITLASWSTKYRVFISRVGESDLVTDEFISNQPYLGSLFKSQNASTWEPSQWEDLKFILYRAEFVPEGQVQVYNPILSEGNGQVAKLMTDSVNLNSRRIRIGLTSSVTDGIGISTQLSLGNTVLQQETNATGNFVGSAGIATGSLSIVNSGIGYTPSLGSYTFSGIGLTNVTGSGKNITADVTIENGVAIAATVVTSGTGYQVGDVLGISTIGNSSVGRNARFSIVSIASTNEFILDNVQGNFVIAGAGKTVQYINNLGITTTLNASSGGGVQVDNIEVISDGLHIEVDHKNHGMYHELNRVTLSNVESDIIPTKLTLPYSADSTANITVDSTDNFDTFENVSVGTTYVGYLLIDNEIISYTGASGGVISGISRGIDGTLRKNYIAGTPVYKYEMGGVSLRRINKTHVLSDATVSNPITFDSYNIKLDMSSAGVARTDGVSFPQLYANQTKSSGGKEIRATQNMPFEIISPVIGNTTVQGTNLTAELRTTSGSSLNDGNGQGIQIPFIDQGFEPINLNRSNYLSSPRIIASRVNETNNTQIQALPGDRSLGLRLNLSTVDNRLSPMVDTQRMSAILVSNRVDNLISNYATDNRVNAFETDPSACQYLSKEINLQESASSIKVLLSAHINEFSDIRVFYAIGDKANFKPIFVPFPGYANLNEKGEVISLAESDGRPDTFISKVNSVGSFDSLDLDFKEYTFTVNNLPNFKSYRIKINLTSSDQTYPPRIKELRVITLA